MPHVEGFTDLEEIGRGGFSIVYAATETSFGRRVALKVLGASHHGPRHLEREALALGKLSSLPGVVAAYQVTRTSDGRPVLVMELLAESLGDRIDRSGAQPVSDVLQISERIATALDAAHRAGVHHRDLKPENVLLSARGEARLADLGIAEIAEVDDSSATVHSLTPPHAPPEKLLGAAVDPVRADLYSLASTVFMAMTGAPPFGTAVQGGVRGLMTRIVDAPLPRPSDMEEGVHAVFVRALAKRPEDRYADAASFHAALLRAVADSRQRRGADRHTANRSPAGRRTLLALAGVAVLAVLGGLLVALTGEDEPTAAAVRTTSTLPAASTTAPVELPVEPFMAGDAVSLSVGSGWACVELEDGRAGCWGANVTLDFEELGISAPDGYVDHLPYPFPLQTGSVRDVEVGANWTGGENLCVAASSGQVSCAGWSIATYSADMDADEVNRSDVLQPVPGVQSAEQVAVGADHACAVLEGGAVSCWGDNEFGQLGDGTRNRSLVAREVQGLTGVVQLTAGGHQSCARRTDSTVWCWGIVRPPFEVEEVAWQVPGLPPVDHLSTGGRNSCAVAAGEVWCWGTLEELLRDEELAGRREPLRIDLPGPATHVAVGQTTGCAVIDEEVWCWGGEHGVGTPEHVEGVEGARAVAVEDVLACALLEGGAVSCWGLLATPHDDDQPPNPYEAVSVPGLGGA